MAERRKKRPCDPIALAKLIGDIAPAKSRTESQTIDNQRPLSLADLAAGKAGQLEQAN
jgi:hypothetical protein